jgi:hypothetical protein
MATSPNAAIANIFLPNLVKLRGPSTFVSSVERQDYPFFDQIWTQAHVTHRPAMSAKVIESGLSKGTYRIATVSLPAPKDMGEAYLFGLVVKKNDTQFARIFTLDKHYVLRTNQDGTMIVEREGSRQIKHGDGPAMLANGEPDAAGFVDSMMAIIEPQEFKKK